MAGNNTHYEPVAAKGNGKQKATSSKSKYDKEKAASGKHKTTNRCNVREVGTAGSKSLRTQSRGSGVSICSSRNESGSEGERMMFPMDEEDWKKPGSSKTLAQTQLDKTTPRFVEPVKPSKKPQEKQASKQTAKANETPFTRFVEDAEPSKKNQETQASRDAAKRKDAKIKEQAKRMEQAKANEQARLKTEAKFREQAMIKEAAEAKQAAKAKRADASVQTTDNIDQTTPRFVKGWKSNIIGGPKTPKPKFPRDDGIYTMNQGPDAWSGHICDYPGAMDDETVPWQAEQRIRENALGLTDEEKMRRKCNCPRHFPI